MKEYATVPQLEETRLEITSDILMSVSFGGRSAEILRLQGQPYLIKVGAGDFVVLISNRGEVTVTVAAELGTQLLKDIAAFPDQNEFVELKPGQVSRLNSAKVDYNNPQKMYVIADKGGQLVEQTFNFSSEKTSLDL
jgi:hypothetical protein